jgi:hypothetical protein
MGDPLAKVAFPKAECGKVRAVFRLNPAPTIESDRCHDWIEPIQNHRDPGDFQLRREEHLGEKPARRKRAAKTHGTAADIRIAYGVFRPRASKWRRKRRCLGPAVCAACTRSLIVFTHYSSMLSIDY